MSSSSSSAAASAPSGPAAGGEEVVQIQLRMQNIMATCNLCTRVDLNKVTQTARNAEYNPKRFQAVIMRIREPRTTALIFASGKMIVTGARDIQDAEHASKKYVAIINKCGFPQAVFREFKVQNITASCDVGFPIKIEALCYANQGHATYEPELFPGLIYRMTDPKVTMICFVSGKIVLTGARSQEALTLAFQKLFPKLCEHRKRNIVVSDGQSSAVVEGSDAKA